MCTVPQGMRTLLSTLVLVCSVSSLFAAATADDIRATSYHFDFLTFKSAAEDKSFLEVFCQIPTENLHFVNTNDGVLAQYHLDIKLENARDEHVERLSYQDSVKVDYDEGGSYIPTTHLIRFSFDISPGDYVASIDIADSHANWGVSFTREINVSDYGLSGLQMSDIQLSNNISESQEQSVLVKNNKKIVPNPSHLFGLDTKKLFAYSEVYNLSRRATSLTGAFLTTYRILDKDGSEVKRLRYRFNKPGSTGAFGVGIPVDDLKSGHYKLVMQIEDLDSFEVQHKVTQFHVINVARADSNEEYGKLLRQLRYLAPEYEIEYLAALPLERRQEGLGKFWMSRDPIVETAKNEFRNEYFRRLYYANHQFDGASSDGWETDQGQIYVKNGSPDRIDRMTSSENSKLYEIWNYTNLDRKFIFVDNLGTGNFRLLKVVNASEQEFTLQ